MSNQTFEPNLHPLSLAKRFLYEIRLTLEEDELTIREEMLLEELGHITLI